MSETPRDISYCSNVDCSRDCERNISKHNFKGCVFSISNFQDAKDFVEATCTTYIPIDDNKVYTDIWNGFQFRPPTYIDGHFNSDIYDLVLWSDHDPISVIDGKTGQKKISTRSCIVVGSLKWDKKEHYFRFESCGLRYLEYHIEGLDKWILEFAEKETQKRLDKED